MSNSVKAFLAGLCSVLVFFILVVGCFDVAVINLGRKSSSYYEDTGINFLILTGIFLIAVPIVQYKLSRNLKADGKEEIGRAIRMSIVVEMIILAVILFFFFRGIFSAIT
ncbi:MAG: hypothetical protein KF900_00585 [Bacteroidetes bacterium]|nr:hypothetical protein [Bacteroidota bacterium]